MFNRSDRIYIPPSRKPRPVAASPHGDRGRWVIGWLAFAIVMMLIAYFAVKQH